MTSEPVKKEDGGFAEGRTAGKESVCPIARPPWSSKFPQGNLSEVPGVLALKKTCQKP